MYRLNFTFIYHNISSLKKKNPLIKMFLIDSVNIANKTLNGITFFFNCLNGKILISRCVSVIIKSCENKYVHGSVASLSLSTPPLSLFLFILLD